ncbi:large terminase protein [uncultured Caudovirales phage]|uniref:Large terminase protein n=1 Tax=uncultured Caudovirales phage TaxID=2100421 RepID=A0A6J5M0C9_9CAUD|nr:large terminase protein [uncultured Caudovirales phage]
MTTTEQRRIEVRKRLFEDFEYYAPRALKIRTKKGEIANFSLNKAQKILNDTVNKQIEAEGRVRIIVLKARQMGLSTSIGGWLYWWTSQRKAQKTMVVTHHAESTKALFDLTKRYYDNTPEALKPHTKYSSRKEIKFDKLDSGYAVATAGGESIGRGETLTGAHLSELAFWPKSSAKDNLNGLLQCIPNSKGTAIFIESTANGVSGEFYDLWQGAVKGENGFIPVFLPWYIQDEYRERVPKGFVRTPEEERLVEAHGLDDAQLMFRRYKVIQNGIDLFRQEYPTTAEEAFLTSGRPVFNPTQLVEAKRNMRPLINRMGMLMDKFVDDPRGELKQYAEIDPGETYYIGADVAMGVNGGDYSVAQVLDSKKNQVAVWRGHIHPDYFANTLYHLGMLYNGAEIIVERNNHGILTCTRLGKDLAYPNFYTETVYDKLDDKDTVNLGFYTSVKTKPLIIDQLRAALRDGEITLNDEETIGELMTYIVTDNGNMEADDGCHDDTVMSLAMVNHIHCGVFTPIESTDDFYITAI